MSACGKEFSAEQEAAAIFILEVKPLRWLWLPISCLVLFLCLSVLAYAETDYETAPEAERYIACVEGLTDEEGSESFVVLSKDELAEYQKQEKVISYEPDYEVTLLSENWNLDEIHCEFQTQLGCCGDGIRVAVIDSGLSVEDAGEIHMVSGYNYIADSTDTTDTIGHGTFVSGIIASQSYGVSACAQIVPLKCFDAKNSSMSYVLKAIYDAVDTYHCRIINMSFGTKEESQALKEAVEYAASKGVILVASAGNDGTEVLNYPAAFDCVIGVGSVGQSKTVSSFSQRNESVFVTAPGEALESTRITGYTGLTSGTSFSAPHVAALAAAALNIQDDLDAESFKTLLAQTATDLGAEGYDICYGYGLINSEAMMKKLLEGKELFASPVCAYDEQGLSFSVYSSMEEPLQAKLLLAGYTAEGKYQSFTSQTVELAANAVAKIKLQVQTDRTKVFLLSEQTFLPLTQSRTYERKSEK